MQTFTISHNCKPATQPHQVDSVPLQDLSHSWRQRDADPAPRSDVQLENEPHQRLAVNSPNQRGEHQNTNEPSSSRRWFSFYHVVDATSADIRDLFGESMDHLLWRHCSGPPRTTQWDCLTNVALERTWLAYNRTANTLVSHSIVVAQLWILHDGQRTVGRVCASVMIVGGIIVDVLGALRYLQQCRAILDKDPGTGNGRAIGGFQFIVTSGIVFGFVSCGLFVLLLVVS